VHELLCHGATEPAAAEMKASSFTLADADWQSQNHGG
jgi:hypothetical protein